jgi:hypothetical protein
VHVGIVVVINLILNDHLFYIIQHQYYREAFKN